MCYWCVNFLLLKSFFFPLLIERDTIFITLQHLKSFNFVVQWLSHVKLMDCSPPSFPVPISQSLLKLMSIGSVMPSNHLILCHPLLLLSSIFPRIRVFSNESALGIKWPKYWSFTFSVSSSGEYSGLWEAKGITCIDTFSQATCQDVYLK